MGDFFLDSIRDKILEHFFADLPKAEIPEVDPLDFECKRLEDKRNESYYLQRPHFFLDDLRLEKCLDRRDPSPAAPSPAPKPDARLLKTFESAWSFIEKLGASAEHYAERGLEYWKDPSDMLGQAAKIMMLMALGGGSSEESDKIRKNKAGDLRGKIEFRGKTYEIETRDDLIIVNGQSWRFEGTTSKTEAASIKVEGLSYDPDQESLELNIKGSLLFFEEKVSKSFQGDQVAKLLEALTTSAEAIATPEMQAKGIRLVPKEVA